MSDASAYLPWSGARVPLADARGAADGPLGRVAGRYLHGASRDLLEDATAVLEIASASPRPAHGDHVAGLLELRDGAAHLRDVEVLTPALRAPSPELLALAAKRPQLEKRAAIVAAIRQLFTERGFLEVETPSRVLNPGLEPHLRPFRTEGRDGRELFLATSPELHLKRLLAAGYERVFELARCWRDEELGALHVPEFLMLEWYRSHAGLDAIAADIAELLPRCAEAAGAHPARAIPRCDLAAAPELVAYFDAFERHAGRSAEGLPPAEREQVFTALVEPKLGRGRPTLVTDWPEDAAALARLRRDARGRVVAARMELYVAGIELANGFDELTDPAEQRRRHEHDRELRRLLGTDVPPLDEGFLEALEAGMPPSAGIAVGVDRLVMLLTGATSVGAVRAFPR